MIVRARFAPSPTGLLHVGNIRTCLYNYLLARKHGGACILRIEDTDRTRYSPEAEDYIYRSCAWLGITFDESPATGGPYGPYRQSERKEAGLYQPVIDHILREGLAYKAFDTPAELEEMRSIQSANKQPLGYFGGVWRDADPAKVEQAEAAGLLPVVRLKMPRGKTIAMQDAIRGRIEWNTDDVDDPVLIKADGMPTYHFAAMVDDHLMEITHVIRGAEWISSAPKHAWFYEMMGWEKPIFVHCPVINGKDGKKLSKRHGATTVLDYKPMGFLPESLANFIALIGWSPKDDREILHPQELIEAFDLDGLQPSPGVFDFDKLKWMNGMYLRQISVPDLTARASEFVNDPAVEAFYSSEDAELPHGDLWPGLRLFKDACADRPTLAEDAIRLEQERVSTLAELGEACAFLFQEEVEMDPKAVEKWFSQPHVRDMLASWRTQLAPLEAITADECDAMIRAYAADHGIEKIGPVVHPTRVALTGKTVGPGLFELMAALGPARMIQRIDRAMGMLS